MRKTRWVPIAAMLLATGCKGFFSLGDWGSFDGGGSFTGCCSPTISSTPMTRNLFSGDTIRLFTIFFPVATTDSTMWTVSDSAFRVIRTSAAPRDSATLVAARRGSTLVTASRGSVSTAIILTAHDSADVTAVRVWLPTQGTTIRQTLAEYATRADLLVGSTSVSGSPTWSTSDTTRAVIAVRAGPSFDPEPRVVIVPRATGAVYVIASWRTMRDSVSVTIVP